MATLSQVDPTSFIKTSSGLPAFGRGAWTRTGIDFDYRYALSNDPAKRIGTVAQKSLDHWAVAAGSYAIQSRLVALGYMDPLDPSERGIFGPRTKAGVEAFQKENYDPAGNVKLTVDGTVGTSDARALFTPLISAIEDKYSIPNKLLLGETNHESALDPGAVGYYIYYPDFRGVDRGISQINSAANATVSWLDAFDPGFAIDWSGARLRTYFHDYNHLYPGQKSSVLWEAAVCSHNNPSAGAAWAKNGYAPTEAAAKYVTAVKNARY